MKLFPKIKKVGKWYVPCLAKSQVNEDKKSNSQVWTEESRNTIKIKAGFWFSTIFVEWFCLKVVCHFKAISYSCKFQKQIKLENSLFMVLSHTLWSLVCLLTAYLITLQVKLHYFNLKLWIIFYFLKNYSLLLNHHLLWTDLVFGDPIIFIPYKTIIYPFSNKWKI